MVVVKKSLGNVQKVINFIRTTVRCPTLSEALAVEPEVRRSTYNQEASAMARSIML